MAKLQDFETLWERAVYAWAKSHVKDDNVDASNADAGVDEADAPSEKTPAADTEIQAA